MRWCHLAGNTKNWTVNILKRGFIPLHIRKSEKSGDKSPWNYTATCIRENKTDGYDVQRSRIARLPILLERHIMGGNSLQDNFPTPYASNGFSITCTSLTSEGLWSLSYGPLGRWKQNCNCVVNHCHNTVAHPLGRLKARWQCWEHICQLHRKMCSCCDKCLGSAAQHLGGTALCTELQSSMAGWFYPSGSAKWHWQKFSGG